MLYCKVSTALIFLFFLSQYLQGRPVLKFLKHPIFSIILCNQFSLNHLTEFNHFTPLKLCFVDFSLGRSIYFGFYKRILFFTLFKMQFKGLPLQFSIQITITSSLSEILNSFESIQKLRHNDLLALFAY